MSNKRDKTDENVSITTAETLEISMEKQTSQNLYDREGKKSAEVSIMQKYHLDICENNIENRIKITPTLKRTK